MNVVGNRPCSDIDVSSQTVTIQVPDDVYARIRQRAELSQRTVEAEFVSVLSEAVHAGEELPQELADAIAPLEELDDAKLWELARGRLPKETSAELQSLHFQQQRGSLTNAERERAEALCLDYDRTMLVRARAAALLKERGHDIASVLENR